MPTPPYADIAQVRDIVSRTAGEYAGTAGSVSDSTLHSAISSAQQVIDSRLGRLYAVPFNPVPKIIEDIATAFAAMDADLTFREVRDYSSELNPVLLRYKRSEEMLVRLEKGLATIPDYVPPDPDPEPPDNPRDAGSVVGVYNTDVCDALAPACRCRGACYCDPMSSYYGWNS